MIEKPQNLWVWFAGLLPLLGLCALVAKAEVSVRNGPTFRIPIQGYDPRDLIHGQYLRYEFEFDWQGDDTCDFAAPTFGNRDTSERTLRSGCCLCLTRSLPNGVNPSVRHVNCAEAAPSCDGQIVVDDVMPPLRYFVPEDKAPELERALNTARPSLEFTLPSTGKPAIKELYLGDAPWRESVGQ